MMRLPQNQLVKEKSGFWSLNLAKLEYWCFSLIVLLLPTQFGKHFWFGFSYLQGLRIDYLSPTLYVTDCLLLLLGGIVWWRNKQSVLQLGNAVWFRVLLIIFGLLLTRGLVSLSPGAFFYGLIKLCELVFFGWYVARKIVNPHQLCQVCLLLTVGIIGETGLSVVQLFLQHSVGGALYFLGERTFSRETPGIADVSLGGTLFLRPYGTFSHPNVLAGYLLLSSIFVVGCLFISLLSLRQRIWIWLTLVCAVVGICISLSRTTMVLFVISLVYLCLFGSSYLAKKTRWWIIAVGLGFLCLFVFTPLFQRFASLSLGDQSITERIFLMDQAVQIWSRAPLLGVGLNNFLPELTKNAPTLSYAVLQPVHNTVLLVLSETGILGLLSTVYVIGKTFQHVWQVVSSPMKNVLVLLLTVWILLGMTDHYLLTLQQGQLITAFVFGLCWSPVFTSQLGKKIRTMKS